MHVHLACAVSYLCFCIVCFCLSVVTQPEPEMLQPSHRIGPVGQEKESRIKPLVMTMGNVISGQYIENGVFL